MKYFLTFLVLASVVGCGGPEPRRPIKVKTGSFFKESVERNKELLSHEEKLMRDIIAKDTVNHYKQTADGSWYYYVSKNETADYLPQPGDLVTMTYNVVSFDNDTIYSMEEIGPIAYRVDKQEVFPGLRNSVKLLKEKETATFLLPSSLAYGYHGDDNKIGINVPVKTTVSILKIEKQKDSIHTN